MLQQVCILKLGQLEAQCSASSVRHRAAPTSAGTDSGFVCRLKIGNSKVVITQDAIWRQGKLHPLYDKVAAASEVCAIVIPHSQKGVQVCVLLSSLLLLPKRPLAAYSSCTN